MPTARGSANRDGIFSCCRHHKISIHPEAITDAPEGVMIRSYACRNRSIIQPINHLYNLATLLTPNLYACNHSRLPPTPPQSIVLI